LGAIRFKSAGALDSAVAVAVGLNYRTNGDLFAGVLLNSVEVVPEGLQRNFRPGPAVENQGTAFGYLH